MLHGCRFAERGFRCLMCSPELTSVERRCAYAATAGRSVRTVAVKIGDHVAVNELQRRLFAERTSPCAVRVSRKVRTRELVASITELVGAGS